MSALLPISARPIASFLALLALLLASFPEAMHHEDLHAAWLAPIEQLSSGCGEQHPPRFEHHLVEPKAGCPGCLLQLQHRLAAPPTAASPPPAVADRVVSSGVAPAPLTPLLRSASPRGPPAA